MSDLDQNDRLFEKELYDFIIANYLFGDQQKMPDRKDSLIGKGIIDSTGILELIEFLEDHFHIEIAEEETVPQNLDSIACIAEFLKRKVQTAANITASS